MRIRNQIRNEQRIRGYASGCENYSIRAVSTSASVRDAGVMRREEQKSKATNRALSAIL